MEDRRRSGIFLGIVSVATLIVAIIGATFAYFSAASNSAENAVDLTAYEFNASLSVSQILPVTAASLIPLNPTTTIANAPAAHNTNLLYALNEATAGCIDDSGLQVCALYQVQFTNNGSRQLVLDGTLKTIANTASTRTGAQPFSNLTYQEVAESSGDYSLTGSAVTLTQTVNGITDIADMTVPAGETVTKYFVIYLNENGDQSQEMGAHYEGQLIYTSTDGTGNTLTGTFTVAGG